MKWKPVIKKRLNESEMLTYTILIVKDFENILSRCIFPDSVLIGHAMRNCRLLLRYKVIIYMYV